MAPLGPHVGKRTVPIIYHSRLPSGPVFSVKSFHCLFSFFYLFQRMCFISTEFLHLELQKMKCGGSLSRSSPVLSFAKYVK